MMVSTTGDPPGQVARRPATQLTAGPLDTHQRRPTRRGQLQHTAARVEQVGRYYDDAVLVFSRFHAAAAATLSRLPGWVRYWDAESGCWRVHPGYTDRVVESLRQLGVDVEIAGQVTS